MPRPEWTLGKVKVEWDERQLAVILKQRKEAAALLAHGLQSIAKAIESLKPERVQITGGRVRVEQSTLHKRR